MSPPFYVGPVTSNLRVKLRWAQMYLVLIRVQRPAVRSGGSVPESWLDEYQFLWPARMSRNVAQQSCSVLTPHGIDSGRHRSGGWVERLSIHYLPAQLLSIISLFLGNG